MQTNSVEKGEFRIVIPARLNSTRLPGKVLLDIAGKPLVQHVWEQSVSSGAEQVVIATDDSRVARVAEGFGATVCMTSEACRSGTDRVAEVCQELAWTDDKPVVNVQGDAPLMPPKSIRTVAGLLLDNPGAEMATLCVGIDSPQEYMDPNVVKVVFDRAGRALYFSRSPIPADSHGGDGPKAWRSAWRHLGLYAYRAEALQRLASAEPCELESLERLEQLRAMWMGMTIMIAPDTEDHGPDVDTQEDLLSVEAYLARRKSE
jgi:3-deoxy-manno-octulosonate cytidylyltransferase (CMP-KDO synthetase)